MGERLFLRLDGDPAHAPESSVPPGTLRDHAVPPALRGHLQSVMSYSECIAPGQEVLERVLPDGAVRLIIDTAGPLQAHVVGATAAPAVLRLAGTLQGLSVALQPGAAAAVLGVPARELSGLAVPLQDLWRGTPLPQQLAEAGDDPQRVELLLGHITRRVRQQETDGPARQAAVAARWLQAGAGTRPLREAAALLGIGERRLQQLFREHVGLGARSWSRLARLHACLRALRSAAQPRWAELAAEAGFYDQSHLVNEFRALCGLTPAEFVRRRVSVSSKTPA